MAGVGLARAESAVAGVGGGDSEGDRDVGREGDPFVVGELEGGGDLDVGD